MTGLQRFAATLTERFAGLPPPAVTELADRLTAALRVSVTGRPGVGRRTVAAVLNRAAGIRVTDADAEVRIRVLAEVVKPEDAAALGSRPDLLILNKADLAGLRAGGPMAAAARDCAEITARTGIPAAPMVALASIAFCFGVIAACPFFSSSWRRSISRMISALCRASGKSGRSTRAAW